jgi:hypothetical protein
VCRFTAMLRSSRASFIKSRMPNHKACNSRKPPCLLWRVGNKPHGPFFNATYIEKVRIRRIDKYRQEQGS